MSKSHFKNPNSCDALQHSLWPHVSEMKCAICVFLLSKLITQVLHVHVFSPAMYTWVSSSLQHDHHIAAKLQNVDMFKNHFFLSQPAEIIVCYFAAMVEPPLKRRRGGFNQRIAKVEREETTGAAVATSQLAESLKEKWAWGQISPQELQEQFLKVLEQFLHVTWLIWLLWYQWCSQETRLKFGVLKFAGLTQKFRYLLCGFCLVELFVFACETSSGTTCTSSCWPCVTLTAQWPKFPSFQSISKLLMAHFRGCSSPTWSSAASFTNTRLLGVRWCFPAQSDFVNFGSFRPSTHLTRTILP